MASRFLRDLKLRFHPPRLTDPDFGDLLYIFIPRAPERSYWECQWTFPATGEIVDISIPGNEAGPNAEAKQFYLSLPARFERLLIDIRPRLNYVFREWLQQELPEDILSALKLSGFGVTNPEVKPVRWEAGFEATGPKWLGITIPFIGDEAQEPIVDT